MDIIIREKKVKEFNMPEKFNGFVARYKATRRQLGATAELRRIKRKYRRGKCAEVLTMASAVTAATNVITAANICIQGNTDVIAKALPFVLATIPTFAAGAVASYRICNQVSDRADTELSDYRRQHGQPTIYGKGKNMVDRREMAIFDLGQVNGRNLTDKAIKRLKRG